MGDFADFADFAGDFGGVDWRIATCVVWGLGWVRGPRRVGMHVHSCRGPHRAAVVRVLCAIKSLYDMKNSSAVRYKLYPARWRRMRTFAEDADAPNIAKKRRNGRKYSMVKGVKSGTASTHISCILMPRSGVQKAACSDVFRGDPHHL